MSAPSSWLQKQRKSDLQGLAEQVGLKDYENLKKTELESALDEHMRANQTRLSKDSNLEAFYKRVASAASPVKKAAVALITSGDEEKEKKPRARRTTRAREEIEPTESSEPELSTTTALMTRTPRALKSLVSSLQLPPSPSQVADQIDHQTAELRSSISTAWERSGVAESAESLRETLSTVAMLQFLTLGIEAWALRSEVLPMSYLTTFPAIKVLRTSKYAVKIPDLFALLNMSFWGPFSLWLVTSILLPLTFAYFFNLSLKATRGRKLRHQFDPLTFHVAKALLSWLVYAKGVTGGWASPLSVVRVEGNVPGGWRGLVLGAIVGGVMSVYEAVLKK